MLDGLELFRSIMIKWYNNWIFCNWQATWSPLGTLSSMLESLVLLLILCCLSSRSVLCSSSFCQLRSSCWIQENSFHKGSSCNCILLYLGLPKPFLDRLFWCKMWQSGYWLALQNRITLHKHSPLYIGYQSSSMLFLRCFTWLCSPFSFTYDL